MTETEAQVFMEMCVAKYGLTARGLQLHHNIEVHEYLDAVHDSLPYGKEFVTYDVLITVEKLQVDTELVKMLSTMKCKKWVFTNAHSKHMKRVMDQLGIAQCFDGVIDIHDMDFQAKVCCCSCSLFDDP